MREIAGWIELSELDVNLGGAAALFLPSRPEVAIHHTADVKLYRGFPAKLLHDVPNWVADGALFHIRVALDREVAQRSLTDATLAPVILDSVKVYAAKQRWHITLFVLMPDHCTHFFHSHRRKR